jgi:uroporphyrin-III C-methyltransferase/precorrin-2 dehydrogenase/sirohydrochlorin ferrochelatase/uroporphyrin-III C-methyltransferase
VVFATGFRKHGALELDWPLLARPGQTLVIYMGISRLEDICRELIAHGLPPSTPVAAIERGTTAQQRIATADLAGIAQRVRETGIRPPALIIVGGVVSFYPRLKWFNP